MLLMKILIFITLFLYGLSTIAYACHLFGRNQRFADLGYWFLIIGSLFLGAIVFQEAAQSGHIPVHNLHGTLLVAGLMIALVFIVFQYRIKFNILGVFMVPILFLMVITATLTPYTPLHTKNIFNSFWLITHIITIFIGEACLALACATAFFYLIQEHAIKTKTKGFFFNRLPSLEWIDHSGYIFIITGFTALTIGLITGFIYAELIWGRFWSWDPKEVWAGGTWLLYAALLHGRISAGWRGRKAALLSIAGFAILLFTFFGVNFLMKGHHGEFTAF
ncbi:MAG: c-type cytochrome biogenesis protein CcsB [Desulfobacterium sp.]|nr:c-type cytochrome biogenesis protein CcsB [Desulfobacterium sp.]